MWNDEAVTRLHGKATASVPDEQELVADALSEIAARPPTFLGEEFDRDESDRLAAKARLGAQRSAAGHKSNPKAREILNTAFGGDYWEKILDETPISQRQQRAVELYEDLLRRSGASYVLRFSIDTREGRHKYFLMHASRSKAAFRAMKEAMYQTHTEHERDSAENLALMPEFLSSADHEKVADNAIKHFAGRVVRWKGDSPREESLYKHLLEETPLLIHEFPALRGILDERGLSRSVKTAKGGKAGAYEFPEE